VERSVPRRQSADPRGFAGLRESLLGGHCSLGVRDEDPERMAVLPAPFALLAHLE
jgi:hypothetical protein